LRQAGSSAAAAIASAATHAPENAAYGLIAFAALGGAFGPVAMGLALPAAAPAASRHRPSAPAGSPTTPAPRSRC